MDLVVCADFGSTFTKALLVSLDDADVVASAEQRSTVDTDVLDGFATCQDQLVRVVPGAGDAPVLACSSAAGGLRIAVVGNEELVTAEAGRRVALSSGGRVVHVGSGGLDEARLAALRSAAPDVVLLVGGTDGGNSEAYLGAASALARVGWPGPVVAAGNADAAGEVAGTLDAGRVSYEMAVNVVPRIGVLDPEPARERIRAAFLRHVIGGKQLSASHAFAEMVTGPTPDVVLTGTEALAEQVGDVAVVDVGGATTDVHSVVELDPEEAGLAREVVARSRLTRSVEGHLGMRCSAPPTLEQGVEAGLVDAAERPGLERAARERRADPGLVPGTARSRAADHRLAEIATQVALRRHAGRQRVVLGPDGRVVERNGTDLREIGILVGSGGVLRHAGLAAARRLLRTGTGADPPGGWLLPRSPRLAVDESYVLAAVGLLARSRPEVAAGLLRRHLLARLPANLYTRRVSPADRPADPSREPQGGLVLGPVQRYVDESSASVWVEVVRPGLVSVRAGEHRGDARTFTAHGHHYAIVDVTGLPPGAHRPYEVFLDEQRVWPPVRSLFPPSALRTIDHSRPLRIAFGTCRASVPHDRRTNRRYGIDVLRALALRLADTEVPETAGSGRDEWPSLVLFLGDQVYADDTSDAMREYITHHRNPAEEPGDELADFGEYAHLYRLSWSEPTVRWAMSTLPSAMVFDDHDVRDDWNTSEVWRQQMRATSWWRGRIVAGLASYWIYQHLGNLSPAQRQADPVWSKVQAAGDVDVGALLDEFGGEADDDPEAYRWSFARDLGRNRLVVVDSRAARVTEPDRRAMLDVFELEWLDEQLTGGFDHLLLATSIPVLLPMGLHNMEAWNEAVVAGAWGRRLTGWGERVRQRFDLEHWAAFQRTFRQVQQLVAEVAAGDRGEAPATVVFLSGDVHHSYLVDADLPTGPGRSRVVQAVCSPIRNPLPQVIRFVTATMAYGVAGAVGKVLARSARVEEPPWTWRVSEGPWFDNAMATLDIQGRQARLAWETAREGPDDQQLLWCTVHDTRLS